MRRRADKIDLRGPSCSITALGTARADKSKFCSFTHLSLMRNNSFPAPRLVAIVQFQWKANAVVYSYAYGLHDHRRARRVAILNRTLPLLRQKPITHNR